MMKTMILLEIYKAITTAPQVLTPPFIDELLKTVLPISESEADDKVVKQAINNVYQKFPEVMLQIKALMRKNLDDAVAEHIPGYETVTNSYPDIKKLEKSLKKRIQNNSNPTTPNAKN
jgi:cytochrome c oxidase assembly factor CtaG